MSRVGIIGDTHLPFELEGYLDFCIDTFEAWGVDTVVHIGDMFDNHSLSFHDSEPMLHNVLGEYESAYELATGTLPFQKLRSSLATMTASLRDSFGS
ncbi:hypothetical protein N9Y23_09990 [Pseudomonadales bacterium]|nr:hypothetical protein [Pseudomonadales bacterium]